MKVGFLGDFCPVLNDFEMSKISSDIQNSTILKELNKNNFNIANLEMPITESSSPISKIGPSFKTGLKSMDILHDLKINCVSTANNHISDYGLEGILDTRKNLESKTIQYAGDWVTSDSNKNYHISLELNGVKLAIIFCAEDEFNSKLLNQYGSFNTDPISNFYRIKYLKTNHDHVIVYPHGGIEDFSYPTIEKQKLYRFFIDSGASAVVGNHTHCIQGFELYNNKPIFYSLGNFFYPSSELYSGGKIGLYVSFDLTTSEFNFKYSFFKQSQGNYRIDTLTKKELLLQNKKFNDISNVIPNRIKLESFWLEYIKTIRGSYLKSLFPLNKFILACFRKFGLLKSKFFQKHLLLAYNYIQCETHRLNLLKSIKSYIND